MGQHLLTRGADVNPCMKDGSALLGGVVWRSPIHATAIGPRRESTCAQPNGAEGRFV